MDKIDKAAKEMNREIFLFFFVKSRFSLKKTPQTADQTFLSLKTKKKALNAHKAQTGLKLHGKQPFCQLRGRSVSNCGIFMSSPSLRTD